MRLNLLTYAIICKVDIFTHYLNLQTFDLVRSEVERYNNQECGHLLHLMSMMVIEGNAALCRHLTLFSASSLKVTSRITLALIVH